MEFITMATADRITAVAAIVIIAIAVITDKLVWHTRLKKAEERADRWEKVALESLVIGAQTGLKAAEVTTAIVSAIPAGRKRT